MSRVLMLVINPMTADSRVHKEASSLGRAGHDVTVVAVAAADLPQEEGRDGYRVLRIPYRRTVKERIVGRRLSAAAQLAEQRRTVRALGEQRPRSLGRRLNARLLLLGLDLRRAGARLSWLIGGALLKALRSRILTVEYWRSIGARIPQRVQRCDVVHAHCLGTLAAAVKLARHWATEHPQLPRPRVVYDSHELYTEQLTRWKPWEKYLWRLHERRWIRHADLVITVSEGIARELRRRYRLPRMPTVVYNGPEILHPGGGIDIRSDLGLPPDRPLAVYVGALKASRGVDRLLGALSCGGDWELALVGTGDPSYVDDLLARASSAGLGDRLHVLPPVPAPDLPAYLRTADLGVHPLLDNCLNHELALPNKLFDYIFAGLPVAVSDLEEMARLVRTHGVGVTFSPNDPGQVAAKIARGLTLRDDLRPSAALRAELADRYGWPAQAERLTGAYAALLNACGPPTVSGDPR